jgi:hypothetical protein
VEATARLIGHGLVPWERVVELADGLSCAWADYQGFHLGRCPAAAPPSSHLWGWSGNRLLRVLVDGEQAIVGELLLAGPVDGGGESVTVAERQLRTYAPEDGRIGAQPSGQLFPGVVHAVEVQGEMPVLFVADVQR